MKDKFIIDRQFGVSLCKKDESYWDMTVLPLTAEQKTYPITPTKDVVCDKCLGNTTKNLEKRKRFYIF